MAKPARQHLPDKKDAPKRSGKRGIGPIDPDHGKTKRLPGMEDAAIEELESAARGYANLRDDRLRLLNDEVDMKENLLALMKKNNKTVYHHNGIEIRIIPEKEKLKVRIKEADED